LFIIFKFDLVIWEEDSGDRDPFGLIPFKYVEISQADEIQGRLTPGIKAILEDAGAVLDGVSV
jgi:hypothetical protein